MVIGHYCKREFESMFIHRFSNDTMPAWYVLRNSAHYWFNFGFVAMYFFLHPDYKPPSWSKNKTFMYTILGLFILFEFCNFMTHITLRDLRKPGTTERGIPQGWGF